MIRKLILILTIIMILASLAACAIPQNKEPVNTPAINPKAEAANKDTSSVALYFCYRNENLLASETRTIDVPVSDPLEAAVINAIIKGPSAGRDELSGLFWNGIELVNVSSNEDILFVTLSDEFISAGPEEIAIQDGTVEEQKKLAIYSIVNTIIEMGKYSRVQILVDRENTETGERITRGEAGWTGDANVYLEPLGREGSSILTPENTLKEALQSYAIKDYTRLYYFTAYISPDSTIKPEIAAFSDALGSGNLQLLSYNVTGSSVSFDGKTAVVMLDYSVKTRTGDTITRENIPFVIIRTNDIWELSYSSLINVLVNVG